MSRALRREVAKKKQRILVLNNDSDFLDLMRQLLDEEGFDVETRKVWDKAYDVVKDTSPDLVILDVLLDLERRGFQLIDLLTLDPKTRDIPLIVASTATIQLHERREAFSTMGIPVISKPFDLDTLLELIRRSLSAGSRDAIREQGFGGPVETEIAS
jgi:CheY-like chemotaxis protein